MEGLVYFFGLYYSISVPLPIFASFFQKLRLGLRSLGFLRPGFWNPSLWSLCPEIVHQRALSKRFRSCGTTTLDKVLIRLISVSVGPENGLSFCVNRFLIISSKLFSSHTHFSISTFIEYFKFFRKFQIIATSSGALSESNSININCNYY